MIPTEILNRFCRLCLLPNDNLYLVYDVCLSTEASIIKVNAVLKLLFKIKPQPNDLKPQKVCLNCIQSIKEFYQYYSTVKENNTLLNKLLSDSTTNEEQKSTVHHIKKAIIKRPKLLRALHKNETLDENDIVKIKEKDIRIKNEGDTNPVPAELLNVVLKEEKHTTDIQNNYKPDSFDNNELDFPDDEDYKDQSSDDDCVLADLKKEIDTFKNNTKKKERCPRYQGKKIKTKFKEGARITCQFCGDKFTDIHSTIRHFEEVHSSETQCLVCLKSINLFMKVHISFHAEVSTSCRPCRLYFGKQELLEEHYAKFDHTSTCCHICNKKFPTKSKRNLHLRVIHYNSAKPFCCEVCGKQFRYLPNMKRHKKTHAIAKRFMCSQCGEKYSTNNALQRHILRVHEGQIVDKKTKEKIPFVPKTGGRKRRKGAGYLTIKCDYCDTILTSKNGYARHLETHPEFRDYTCKHCNIQYPTRVLLRDHLINNHSKHLCQVCGQKFLHQYLLDRHYATVHRELGINAPAFTNMILYECEVCHNKFRSRFALDDHMRVHTGEKPFKCQICGKGFKQKAHLSIHQIQHTGERRNKCHICGKCFTYKSTLESHVRIHTGEKPYSCPYCSNCFRDSTLLLKHKKKEHSDKPITTKLGKIAKPRSSIVTIDSSECFSLNNVG